MVRTLDARACQVGGYTFGRYTFGALCHRGYVVWWIVGARGVVGSLASTIRMRISFPNATAPLAPERRNCAKIRLRGGEVTGSPCPPSPFGQDWRTGSGDARVGASHLPHVATPRLSCGRRDTPSCPAVRSRGVGLGPPDHGQVAHVPHQAPSLSPDVTEGRGADCADTCVLSGGAGADSVVASGARPHLRQEGSRGLAGQRTSGLSV